jgi:polo-like kinase 1
MSKLLKYEQTFSEADTRLYTQQVVEAVRYLHGRLIIHRDLKLGNLFLNSNKVIKIGDFGFATKLTYPDERRKTICGTPNYIAPEILEGKNGHSFEVDIWSTGVILYTLLVGKPPFQSKDVLSTYKLILMNSYDFPTDMTISSDAKNLTHKILQVLYNKR